MGQETEVSSFRSPGEKGPILGTVDKVFDFFTKAINKLESINRSSSALAAYRLELEKSKDKVKAAAAAEEAVHVTHGSYDGFNTPRFLRGDVGKVLGQFRKFQIIQATMLLNMAKDAFKGADATTRAVARRQLAYMIGQAFIVAGARGCLPGDLQALSTVC